MGHISDYLLVAEDSTFAKMKTFIMRKSPPWQRVALADAAQRFKFDPGHPKDGTLYLKNPYRPEVLLLPASANERIAQEKMAAFVEIVQELGASEIQILSTEAKESSKGGHIGLAGIGTSLGIKAMISDSGDVARTVCFKFSPPTRSIDFRPEMLCWLFENPTLAALVEGRRRHGNIQSALVELRVQNTVETSLEADASKFKIGIGGEMRTVTSSTWRFEVKFWDVVAPTVMTSTPGVVRSAPPVVKTATPPPAPLTPAVSSHIAIKPTPERKGGATVDASGHALLSRMTSGTRSLVDYILAQLPTEVSVQREAFKGTEYLVLTSAIDGEWKAWIGARPNEVYVAVYASPEDTIGWSKTTYADRMTAIGLVDVQTSIPEWGKDSRYINTVVSPTSDPLTVAVTAGYLRWFLVEDPQTSRGPRLPPKSAEWVRAQPPEILEQIDVLLSRLPPATKVVVPAASQAARYMKVTSSVDPDWIAWIGYRNECLYVAFHADVNDRIGKTQETYWQRLQNLGYADAHPTLPEWGSEGNLINVVIPSEGASAATTVAEFLFWFLQEAPRL